MDDDTFNILSKSFTVASSGSALSFSIILISILVIVEFELLMGEKVGVEKNGASLKVARVEVEVLFSSISFFERLPRLGLITSVIIYL